MTTDRILLSCNNVLRNAQHEFIEILLPRLNDVLTSFNYFGLGSLTPSNLSDLATGTPPEVILKAKAMSKFANVQMNGFKVKPEKAFELADIDASNFIGNCNSIKNYIESFILEKRYNDIPGVQFDIKFFNVGRESVTMNAEYFEKWKDDKCRKYTSNDSQNCVYKELENLCSALNGLIKIKRSKESIGYNDGFTTERFAANAQNIMKNSESPLFEMLIFKDNKFCIKNEFVLRH